MTNRERLLSGLKSFTTLAELHNTDAKDIILNIKSLIKVIECEGKKCYERR